MRHIFLFLVILCGWSSLWAATPSAIYQRVDTQVVCIRTVLKNGSERFGSGFFISPDHVATVAHQVNHAENITLFLKDDVSGPGRVLAINKTDDTAIIQVPATKQQGLPLETTTPPNLGDEVFTIGCPLNVSHSLSRGVVSHAKRQIDGKHLIQTDLVVNDGSSGGPLVNQTGHVVGIIMGSWKNGIGLNFAVPAYKLASLMQQVEIPTQTVSPQTIDKLLYTINAIQDTKIRFEQLTQLTKRFPHRADIFVSMGEVFRLLERYEDAQNVLIQAIAMDSTLAIAYWHLGMVYADGIHDISSARKAFQKYLQLDPTGEKELEARQQLVILDRF